MLPCWLTPGVHGSSSRRMWRPSNGRTETEKKVSGHGEGTGARCLPAGAYAHRSTTSYRSSIASESSTAEARYKATSVKLK